MHGPRAVDSRIQVSRQFFSNQDHLFTTGNAQTQRFEVDFTQVRAGACKPGDGGDGGERVWRILRGGG